MYISIWKYSLEKGKKREEVIEALINKGYVKSEREVLPLWEKKGFTIATYMGREYLKVNKTLLDWIFEEKIERKKIEVKIPGKKIEVKVPNKKIEVKKKGGDLSFREKFKAQYRTSDGHFVRSRAEVIIDDWLYNNGIAHAYEKKLPVPEKLYTDFYLPNDKIYIEFWGLEENEKYRERKMKKIEIYKKYNMNLIELKDKDLESIDDILPQKLVTFWVKLF